MRVAYVVPRYGAGVIGGAESGARMLAEHLVSQLGWSVEVFTTCARDLLTWKDEDPPGDSWDHGVVVHRYRSAAGRHADFFPVSDRVLTTPAVVSEADAQRWVDLQGPVCPDLVEAVKASDADVIVFYPYLYYPTVRAIGAVSARAVLHPAAHDEPVLQLAAYRSTFASAAGLVFQTMSERRLVQAFFPVAGRRQAIIGLGLDEAPDPAQLPSDPLDLGDRPYLCCLGRVDDLKGSSLLAELFGAYKARRPGPLALAMVGPIATRPASQPDVILTGPVDEATKWAVLRGATALVSPSPNEAFSIVIMEAWSQGRPVLVNASCPATVEHCQASGGGLWFDGYATFEVAVDRLVASGPLRGQLGESGQRYVQANYTWPVLIDRYGRFLEAVVRSGYSGHPPPRTWPSRSGAEASGNCRPIEDM